MQPTAPQLPNRTQKNSLRTNKYITIIEMPNCNCDNYTHNVACEFASSLPDYKQRILFTQNTRKRDITKNFWSILSCLFSRSLKTISTAKVSSIRCHWWNTEKYVMVLVWLNALSSINFARTHTYPFYFLRYVCSQWSYLLHSFTNRGLSRAQSNTVFEATSLSLVTKASQSWFRLVLMWAG